MEQARLVTVALDERSYPIRVVPGGLDGLGAAVAEVLHPGPCVVVSNPMVGALYAHAAMESLQMAGFEPGLVYVPDGEKHKTLATYEDLLFDLLTIGINRHTPVLALGGGVTGDIAGFAAATVLRGVPLVQVPTTLLAMVDSSVGGKTGVNTRHGKNLVGAFYQPKLVFAATQVLATLDNAEWRCGLGEALKHGFIQDEAFFDWMVENAAALEHREPEAVALLVERCCQIKAAVVAADERESGVRAILNCGHTVGHALETALGHGVLRHGEAVGIGMLAETRYCARQGWCQEPLLLERLQRALHALGLPTVAPEVPPDQVDGFLRQLHAASRMDKKASHGTLNLVVPLRVGHVRVQPVSLDELSDLFAGVIPGQEDL